MNSSDGPNRYVRKTFPVLARQVTAENMSEVANWCNGTVRVGRKEPYISAEIIGAMNNRQTRAIIGDWVVLADDGKWKFYTNNAFHKTFIKDECPFDQETSEKILRMVRDFKELLTSV